MADERDTRAYDIVDKLRGLEAMLASVESCTGGQIADRVTNVPGSSDVFFGAWVTYDNMAKQAIGVPAELIQLHGAVSEEVARSMCESGLRRLEEDLPGRTRYFCLATTGIAGPGGATETKPVGLSYVGLARSGAATQVIRVLAPPENDRLANKRHFADQAFDLLLGAIA